MARVGIVGVGNIGGALAQLCAHSAVSEIVLCDVSEGVAKGKALDLEQALCVAPGTHVPKICGVGACSDMPPCDVVIVTAGVPRGPGVETRQALLEVNSEIMQKVARGVQESSPHAFVIIISNPVDTLAWLFWKVSGFPSERVVGMAGVLDTARFRFYLAQALGVEMAEIDSCVVGPHNDMMLPLPEHTFISRVPLRQWLEQNNRVFEDIVPNVIAQTRSAGAHIVQLLGRGSAFFGPAHGAWAMASSFLFNEKRVFPCSALFPWRDVFCGHLRSISRDGLSEPLPLSLTAQEEQALHGALVGLEEAQQALVRAS